MRKTPQKPTTYVEPHILKKYNIIQKVGSGAYGHVWKVEDIKTKQIYALKKIFDAFQHATDAQRTYRQVAVLQQLNHPNVVKLHSTLRAQNNKDLYMIMEYVQSDLHNVISQNVLKQIHKKYIVYQLAKVFKYLHSGNLIHRDLKPSNILINAQCQIKLCDFGLVRSLTCKQDQVPILTQGVATRWYRAPQVLLGSKSYSAPADVWSLGCVVFQILTGKAMFPGNSTMDQLERILQFCGMPEKEDILSLQSELAQTMIRAAKMSSSNFETILKEIPTQFVKLLPHMLKFNPKKRITIDEILNLEIFKPFRKEQQQIIFKEPVKMPLDDNRKESVDKYRNTIYGTKRYSLSRLPGHQNHYTQHLKKNVSSDFNNQNQQQIKKPYAQLKYIKQPQGTLQKQTSNKIMKPKQRFQSKLSSKKNSIQQKNNESLQKKNKISPKISVTSPNNKYIPRNPTSNINKTVGQPPCKLRKISATQALKNDNKPGAPPKNMQNTLKGALSPKNENVPVAF